MPDLTVTVFTDAAEPCPHVAAVEVSAGGPGPAPVRLEHPEGGFRVMFRRPTADEGAGAGFKLYGLGRWAAPHLGTAAAGYGRAHAFAVAPDQAADLVNKLTAFGFLVTAGPEDLRGLPGRWGRAATYGEVRPVTAEQLLAAVSQEAGA